MSNTDPSLRPRIRNTLRVAAAVTAVAVFAVGCTDELDARKHFRSSPAKRIDFDFGGGVYHYSDDASWKNCLEGTPYDPYVEENDTKALAATVTVEGEPGHVTATVTPAGGIYPEATPLVLKGFEDVNHQLRAANQASALILEQYGCLGPRE